MYFFKTNPFTMLYIGAIAVLTGIYLILCSITNHNWFFKRNVCNLMVNSFGFDFTRWVFVILGLYLVSIGILEFID